MPSRTLLGHQGRCFDLRFAPADFDCLLSASEDGTAKLWNISRQKCLATCLHNKSAEVLRASFLRQQQVCTAGSDGCVHIWSSFDPVNSQNTPKKMHTLRHRSIESQVYVCEPNAVADNQLLSAADNEIFLWDTNEGKATSQWDYFPSSSAVTERPFGGEVRNPDNEAYVFDAKWRTQEPHIVGVALSDSTIRLLDTRQRENSIFTITLQNAENDETKLGHATSLNWSENGEYCCVSFGSGHVAILDIRKEECLSLLQFHHAPCYGVHFLADTNSRTIMTWSADSSIGIWDIGSIFQNQQEEVDGNHTPPVRCLYHHSVPDFGILASIINPCTGDIICGGESRIKSLFLGVPLHITNIGQQPPTHRTFIDTTTDNSHESKPI